MPRPSMLRFPLALLVAGAIPVAAACGGQVVPIGTNTSQLEKIDPSTVSGAAAACPSGYAHPNVCCETNGQGPAECGAWEQHPFQACDPGWQTYPNPISCCAIGNDKDCFDTPSDAGPDASAPPSYGCGYACAPGWYAPPGANGSSAAGTCCQVQSDGSSVCESWATSSPAPILLNGSAVSSCSNTTEDAGVEILPALVDAGPNVPIPDASADATTDASYAGDAGSGCSDDDGGSTPWSGYDGGGYSLCPVCPPGWNTVSDAPELCCRLAPTGISECFSQATGPIGTASDGGVSTTPDDGGPSASPGYPADAAADAVAIEDASVSAADAASPELASRTWFAGGGSCSSQETRAGHDHVVDCSLDARGAATCFCQEDGQLTAQFSVGEEVCGSKAGVFGALDTCFGR